MALTANTPLTFIRGELSEAPIKGTTTVYEGAMLGLTSGYARGLVAGDLFIGHAMEYVDNSGGSDGTLYVKTMRGIYRLEVTLTGVAVTDINRKVYASADDTLTLTAGSNSYVGKVVRYVTTNTAIVEFHTVNLLDFALSATVSGEENINTLNWTFAGTGGPKRGLYLKGTISGAGHATYGMFKFRTYLSAAAAACVHTLCANLHLTDNAELADSGEYASAPLYVTIETEVTTDNPDLSGGSLAAMYIGYYVTESGGAPANAYVFNVNTNAAAGRFDGLFRLQNPGDIGDAALSGTTDVTLAGGSKKIPINIAGTTYYLVACVTPSGS